MFLSSVESEVKLWDKFSLDSETGILFKILLSIPFNVNFLWVALFSHNIPERPPQKPLYIVDKFCSGSWTKLNFSLAVIWLHTMPQFQEKPSWSLLCYCPPLPFSALHCTTLKYIVQPTALHLSKKASSVLLPPTHSLQPPTPPSFFLPGHSSPVRVGESLWRRGEHKEEKGRLVLESQL